MPEPTAYKYLHFVPKPLLEDFVRGRVIPFVGAGFSKNAELPAGRSMPDWYELGKRVAEEIDGFDYDGDAVDALSHYEDVYSRVTLVELLMKELCFGGARPGEAHRALCRLFSGIICTTNFDTLIEDELTSQRRMVSVVANEARLSLSAEGECKVIKLHGDFNHPDKMVVTERDYDEYLSHSPLFATYVASLFISNTMLLVGYSLDDPDYRMIWRIVGNRLGGSARPAYAVMVNGTDAAIAKYRRRRVQVVNIRAEGSQYPEVLRDFFAEVKDYVDRFRDKHVHSGDESVNEQLAIPAEDNRLCFLLCSRERIDQLSSLLRPILMRSGVTMVREDEAIVVGPITDSIETSIRKSRAVIVDVSDESRWIELGFAMAQKPARNVLVISNKNASHIPITYDRPVFLYSLDDENNARFIDYVTKWLHEVFGEDLDKPLSAGRRLFVKGEYSASVLSVYSELEYRYTLLSIDGSKRVVPFSLPNCAANVLKPDELADGLVVAQKIRNLRNQIAHGGYVATKEEAEEFLTFAERLVERMGNMP